MNRRFFDDRKTRWSMVKPQVNSPILVKCPQCDHKAIVLHDNTIAICSCLFCGFSKKKKIEIRAYEWYDSNPTDGVFGYDLWLHTRCIGNDLWAYSESHLNFLERYINAILRGRRQDMYGWSNSSVASRLPLWIKKSKNRAKLLKCIKALKSKLHE